MPTPNNFNKPNILFPPQDIQGKIHINVFKLVVSGKSAVNTLIIYPMWTKGINIRADISFYIY